MTIIYTIIVSNLRCHKIRGKQSDSLRKKTREERATWIEDVHCYRACYAVCFVPKTLTGILIHYKILDTT